MVPTARRPASSTPRQSNGANSSRSRRKKRKPAILFSGAILNSASRPIGQAGGHLDARDPVTGKIKWTYESKYPLLASALATSSDLLFTGDPEGNFLAFDATNGKKLWSYQTGSGHRGSPITYSVDGKQYIAVPVGWGSALAGLMTQLWPEAEDFPGGSTLFVFALRNEFVAIGLLSISSAFAAEIDGGQIFKIRCSIGYCHGAEGKPGRAPKLRERDFTGTYLHKVITDGIPNSSMPAFKELLNPAEISTVVNYVLSLSGKAPVQETAPSEPATLRFDKGKALFFDAANGVCHAIDGAGTAIGPTSANSGEPAPN